MLETNDFKIIKQIGLVFYELLKKGVRMLIF